MEYNDLVELGTEAAVKAAGKYRQKGKEYVVQVKSPGFKHQIRQFSADVVSCDCLVLAVVMNAADDNVRATLNGNALFASNLPLSPPPPVCLLLAGW